MTKSYKYRIYPNYKQQQLIDKTFNACRLVYNLGLEVKIAAWKGAQKNISSYELMKQLTELRKETFWLQEVSCQCLQQSLRKLDKAFTNFFNGITRFPDFKKKTGRQSFCCPQGVIISNGCLTVQKIKNIPIIVDNEFCGELRSSTIFRTSSGRYYISILVDDKMDVPPKPVVDHNRAIGIDLGIKSFAVTSNGKQFESNKYLKNSLKRLQCLHFRASRKKKGSKNRKRAVKKLSLLYETITNQRVDYVHKVTTALINDNQIDTFVIEDLNVSGMVKNRRLSKSIHDASFGEFRRQMQYKCDWYGKNLIIIGRFEPSTKTCSACGIKNVNLTLSDREWTCECGATHDRDFNAAKNILRIGLEKYSGQGMSGELVESRRLRRAKKQETL